MKSIILLIVALVVLTACGKVVEVAQTCESLGGTWIEAAQECEDISQEDCETLGGNFNECASPCRNDPNAGACIMQCVLVCEMA